MSQKKHKLLQAKSYTSIYDIFGPDPFNNIFYKSPRKGNEQSIVQTCETSVRQSIDVDHPDPEINQNSYITYEVFNGLNKKSSHKKVIPSTSTLFCDLDDVAKRHSFNCLTELSLSNANFLKVMSTSGQPVSFKAKSNTIVQECATQIYPKIFRKDSLKVNTLKTKTKYPHAAMLSSEIFLRDDSYNDELHKTKHRRHVAERPQKFWSYAKYRTEYTKPIPEEKKKHSKKHGNRVENPCPCQLFSYTCPCTDQKSLTELAQNNNTVNCVDEITSTTKILCDDRKQPRDGKDKKKKGNTREEKPTNTSTIETVEAIVPEKDSIESMLAEVEKNNKNIRSRSRRKSRKIMCPKCKEHVKVVISVSNTEEEGVPKCNGSAMFHSRETPGSTYAYRASPNMAKDTIDEDICTHNPPCEMLPVCQILPGTSTLKDTRHMKKTSERFSPRILRITKACRHHPPCTVVPSCQRLNVLKNNCEFIPPCLHRPRCVNLPLCVPGSKNFQYDEPASVNEAQLAQDTACNHVPKCKHIPACQHNIYGHVPEHGYGTTHVQNTCELLSNLNAPTFLMQPNTGYIPYTLSPVESPISDVFTVDKSFQIDSSHYVYPPIKKDQSNDAVVFIRDVGCQFRNNNYSANDKFLQSRKSSNSFDFVAVKSGTVYTNYHTLRYEDKYTNPQEQLQDVDPSIASNNNSLSLSSGRRARRCFSKDQSTTHYSKPNFVVAFSTVSENVARSQRSENFNTFLVKPRHSSLKSKYRKMFSVKRRRKSKCSTSSVHSRKTMYADGYL